MFQTIKEFLRSKQVIICCILVFIFATIVRVYSINLKQDLFIDENSTTQIASYNKYWLGTPFAMEPNLKLTGEEIKQKQFSLDPSFKATISDIVNLHKYTRDTPHTNFYYTLYRLWFNGWSEFNIKSFMVHGCTLNLIFFAVSFLYLYKILKRLFPNSLLIPFGLFTAFLSTSTISNTIFIRPYALQEMFFMIITHTVIKQWDYLDEKNHRYTILQAFSLGLITALTFLTGYYSAFLIVMYALLLFYKAFRNKNFDAMKFFIVSAIASGYMIFMLYPGVCYVFFSYRAKEAYRTILDLLNLKYFLLHTPIIILRYLYCIPLIAVLIYYLNKIRKEKLSSPEITKIYPILFAISGIWALFILYICPYKRLRYVMSICPILLLIFPYIASFFPKKKTFGTIVTIIFLLNIFIALSDYLGFSFRKYIPFPAKIDFITNQKYDRLIFLKNPDLPVYIISDGLLAPAWLYPNLDDNQIYYTTNVTPTNIPYNHFYTIRNNAKTPYAPKDFPPNYKRLDVKNECADFYICEEYIKLY